jgi:broad specificity phosphatase PhoE
MLEIALIRPGSSDYDSQGRIQGNLELPLNAAGTAEVAAMSAELRGHGLSLIYSANAQPAIESAESLAASLSIKCKKLDKLDNVNMGLWQGMQFDEVRFKHPSCFQPWEELSENVCPPEGETLGEARERLVDALERIVKKHTTGAVGLVLPRPLSDLALTVLASGELGAAWQVHAEFGHWELMRTGALVQGGSA